MRFNVKWLGFFLATALLGACATPPAQAPAAARPAAPAVVLASASAAAPASLPNASLISRGFKPEQYHGGTVYCRSEAVTGTNFKRKVCMTEDQIKEQDRVAQQASQDMNRQKTGPACMKPPCT